MTHKKGVARRQQHKNASQNLGMVVGPVMKRTPVGPSHAERGTAGHLSMGANLTIYSPLVKGGQHVGCAEPCQGGGSASFASPLGLTQL